MVPVGLGSRFAPHDGPRSGPAANPAGFGVTARDFIRDGGSRRWLQASLINRADATAVARWASRRPAPDIGYTFWLGAQTAGLKAAWPSTLLVSRAHRSELYAEAHGWRSIPFQAAGHPIRRPGRARVGGRPPLPRSEVPRGRRQDPAMAPRRPGSG